MPKHCPPYFVTEYYEEDTDGNAHKKDTVHTVYAMKEKEGKVSRRKGKSPFILGSTGGGRSPLGARDDKSS